MKKNNTLLLTPLVKERDILISSLISEGYKKKDLTAGKIKVWRFEELNLFIAAGGHGKAQFALQTQYLFDRLDRIDLLICAGAAGAISNTVVARDIVVATSTIEHDYSLKFIKKKLPEFKVAQKYLPKLEKIALKSKAYKLHFAAIASGDEDIIETDRANEIRLKTGAVAVAWEGAGAARTARFNNVDYLEIRGITDSADKSAKIDFETNLQIAMHQVAELIVNFLA
ncbi:MAG: 5'-methylthioadenosine/S-adenosylhomocysteine nucleosidase [Candidatus Rifleibacteriota bacterium]